MAERLKLRENGREILMEKVQLRESHVGLISIDVIAAFKLILQ